MNLTTQLKKWLASHALHLCWKLARAAYLWAEAKRPAGGFIPTKKPTDGRKK